MLSTKSTNKGATDFTIPGNHLSYYVDIMYIVYANAIKHSHLEKDDVEFECTINKFEDTFEIRFSFIL